MASEASEVVSNADGGVKAAAVTIPKMQDESTESIKGGESGETNGETNGAPQTTQVRPWSQMLQSPRGVESFSPSLEVARPENLHGLGLRLAREKSMAIGQVAHRFLLLLTEITNMYENIGLVSFKCSQLLQPRQLPFPVSLEEQSLALHFTLASFSTSTRQLAQFYRNKIARPLQESLMANGVIVRNSNQRYLQARQQSKEARLKAISARKAYMRAVKNAESAFDSWKRARATKPPLPEDDGADYASGIDGWEKALARLGSNVPGNTVHLVQQLKVVQNCEARYRELVAKENKVIDEVQEVEGLGLNEIQSVVQGRLEFFLDPLAANICNYEKEAIASTSVASIGESTTTSLLEKRIEGGLFAGLFKQQTLKYEEGTGIMEAETLGLPEEAGRLRDKIQSSFAARSARIKVSQALKTVLEELIMANSKLAGSFKVKSQTGKSTSTQTETLQDLTLNSLGLNSADLFRGILQVFDTEAGPALEFVELMNTMSKKLDPFLDKAELQFQASVTADGTKWKQLCDASRLESKAEARYNQIKLQQEKARERALSAEASITSLSDDGSTRREAQTADGVEDEPPSAPTTSRMSKFGSILAGTEAIKKLQENALNTISKITLKDERVAKEKQAFDEATAAKARAITAYITTTKGRIQKLESEDVKGWEDLKPLMESVVSGIDQLRKSRPEARAKPLSPAKKIKFDTLLQDIDKWVESCRKNIAEAEEDAVFSALNKAPDRDTGFSLTVVLVKSDTINELLNLKGGEDEVPTLGIEQIVVAENGTEEIEKGDIGQDQFLDSEEAVDGDKEYETCNDENQKLFQRSLTTPDESAEYDMDEASKKHSISFDDAQSEDEAAKEEALRQTFIKNFWSDRADEPPTILRTISCSYRTKEKGSFLIPHIHGRLYTTNEEIYFLAWDGKSFILPWTDLVSVDVEKGLLGGNETSIAATYLSQAGAEYTFILGRLGSRNSTLMHLRELLQDSRSKANPENSQSPPVPPDTILKKMEVVLSRMIRNVPISRVYEKVWSEGNNTSEEPFYGPWLKKEGCFDIDIKDWEFASDDSEGFVNSWDKECYSQRRLVTFKFKRTTHLYMGSPIAIVKQEQFFRDEGNDKCVMAMRVTFDGIPYADSFAVEVRWIAGRKGKKDVKIEVGLFVDFLKTTMLTSKIKSGTISETKNVHNRLFEAVRNACSVPGEDFESDTEDEADDIATEDKEAERGIMATLKKSFYALPLGTKIAACAAAVYVLLKLSPFVLGSNSTSGSCLSGDDFKYLISQIDELQGQVKSLQKSVDAIAISMKEKNP